MESSDVPLLQQQQQQSPLTVFAFTAKKKHQNTNTTMMISDLKANEWVAHAVAAAGGRGGGSAAIAQGSVEASEKNLNLVVEAANWFIKQRNYL